ncbi:HIT domain-containing protein [Salegentibacter sp. JZCK2]|uniref:HIT domain-containing protein n=1 Tax=Salegentibacter tibetensis TaxID=2873600 RepID=UPI001CCF78B4|nr:HIT domain-containing protein [Salegentibacter tibetensis]MBZ9731541.1 HIT domain-containing protein [Salegentibacter tibetensis]
MSHIYQPVMIKRLLLNKGVANKKEVAQDILSYDFSQVEYYEKITSNMVGRILRKHEIVSKNKDIYTLNSYEELSQDEISEIIEICDRKISEYIDKRGEAIWEHRRKNRKAVSGSIRFQVLKRAKGRCELCGISKEEKALEVDHIVPKNLGGEDSINNYQALCYTCNANKRDTDSTDFRDLEYLYNYRTDNCPFCTNKIKPFLENNLALAFFDKYPVTDKHILVIPKRHCKDYFELTQAELNAINSLTIMVREKLLSKDVSISGYNIGWNAGEDAGQTIYHCHMHLIPRRKGDVDKPVGGVRNTIPGKGSY